MNGLCLITEGNCTGRLNKGNTQEGLQSAGKGRFLYEVCVPWQCAKESEKGGGRNKEAGQVCS